MSSDELKLIITDVEDLLVLSSLLQDATVLIGDMGFDDSNADNGQFMMVAARFIKNNPNDTDNAAGQRRLMGVNFSAITTVQRKGFSTSNRDDVLNILAIRRDTDNIEIICSGEAMIRLECTAISIYAADLKEGWSTAFKPKH